jgi:hypothetical protein
MLEHQPSAMTSLISGSNSNISISPSTCHNGRRKKIAKCSLIVADPVLHLPLKKYLLSAGVKCNLFDPGKFISSFSTFVDSEPVLAVLCLDDFDDIGKLYRRIRHFREERPSVPCILTSTRFKSHDLSAERLPLCDASFKLPLNFEKSLDECFAAVASNNEKWRNRKI